MTADFPEKRKLMAALLLVGSKMFDWPISNASTIQQHYRNLISEEEAAFFC